MARFNSKINVLQILKNEKVNIHPAPTQTHYITVMNIDGSLYFEYLGEPISMEKIYELLNKSMLK